jgi:hypothetical protein
MPAKQYLVLNGIKIIGNLHKVNSVFFVGGKQQF